MKRNTKSQCSDHLSPKTPAHLLGLIMPNIVAEAHTCSLIPCHSTAISPKAIRIKIRIRIRIRTGKVQSRCHHRNAAGGVPSAGTRICRYWRGRSSPPDVSGIWYLILRGEACCCHGMDKPAFAISRKIRCLNRAHADNVRVKLEGNVHNPILAVR